MCSQEGTIGCRVITHKVGQIWSLRARQGNAPGARQRPGSKTTPRDVSGVTPRDVSGVFGEQHSSGQLKFLRDRRRVGSAKVGIHETNDPNLSDTGDACTRHTQMHTSHKLHDLFGENSFEMDFIPIGLDVSAISY